MSAKRRDPQREQFWRATLAEWSASGRTVRDYCRRHRLTETAFFYWRRELRRRGATPVPAASPAFVPVTVVPVPVVEVRCPSGHVVTLRNTRRISEGILLHEVRHETHDRRVRRRETVRQLQQGHSDVPRPV